MEELSRLMNSDVDVNVLITVYNQRIAQLKLRENREPRRIEKNYCYWTNAYEPGNHWNSIKEYEDSKKKKANSPYY